MSQASVLNLILQIGAGEVTQFDEWGCDQFWVNEHCLVRTPEYPDQPGCIAGAVAGQALENLELKIPGTVQKIFAIARGEGDAAQFRSELHAIVGDELYGLMFNRHPYTTWSDIYRRISYLS